LLVSVGSPVLSFIGVFAGHLFLRRGAKELETRSKREETMRNLRWAAELGVSDDVAKAKLGVSQLIALGDSEMLDDAQQLFVDADLDAVVEDPADEIEEATKSNEQVAMIRIAGIGASTSGAQVEPSSVQSDLDPEQEGGDDG
jgi:hypothetical protein